MKIKLLAIAMAIFPVVSLAGSADYRVPHQEDYNTSTGAETGKFNLLSGGKVGKVQRKQAGDTITATCLSMPNGEVLDLYAFPAGEGGWLVSPLETGSQHCRQGKGWGNTYKGEAVSFTIPRFVIENDNGEEEEYVLKFDLRNKETDPYGYIIWKVENIETFNLVGSPSEIYPY